MSYAESQFVLQNHKETGVNAFKNWKKKKQALQVPSSVAIATFYFTGWFLQQLFEDI